MRKLFTDNLDDVSGRYADQNILLAARGPEAVELAYRGDELKNGASYPPENTIRGNPKRKDWYYMSGIRVSIALNNGPAKHRRYQGVLDCPKKVY